jgi:hypothetical protein
MVWNRVRALTLSTVMLGTLGAPAIVAADDCDDGRRQVRSTAYRNNGRPVYRNNGRAVAQRSRIEYVEREPERTKTKTALMIAGSAAAGAGVGGAMDGKRGALIGAAIGGGAASIYEAAKRR